MARRPAYMLIEYRVQDTVRQKMTNLRLQSVYASCEFDMFNVPDRLRGK